MGGPPLLSPKHPDADEVATSMPSAIDISEIDLSKCAICQEAFPPLASFMFTYYAQLQECCGNLICKTCLEHYNAVISSPKLAKHVKKRSKKLAQAAVKFQCPCCPSPIRFDCDDEVRKQWTLLAKAGHVIAQLYLAGDYEEAKKIEVAFSWFQKAADNGLFEAALLLHLVCSTEDDDVIKKKYMQLSKCAPLTLEYPGQLYWKHAAAQFYPPAFARLGEILISQEKYMEAVEVLERLVVMECWFQSFYRDEIHKSQYHLSRALEKTIDWRNVDRFVASKMVFWAQRSAQNGNLEAFRFLTTIRKLLTAKCAHCQKPSSPSFLCGCGIAAYCNEKCKRKDRKLNHTKQECQELKRQHRQLEASIVYGCALCGKENPSYQCSSCKDAYYCDVICQKLHWKKCHKFDYCRLVGVD